MLRTATPRSSRVLALASPALALVLACSGGGEGDDGGAAPGAPTGWPVAVAPGASAPAFERVVLVTIDTLRADHVSCYGYPRETTPFLDSLAARGVRFERAMASISHTAPSHATMLTGLVPAVHGVLQNGEVLDPAATDVADLARAAGLESAAFLNAKFLTGLGASFDHVEVRGAATQDGGRVVDAALEWLRSGRSRERFFLWVHLYDPHEWQLRMRRHEGPASIWDGPTPQGFVERLLALHGLPAPAPGEPVRIEWKGEQHGDPDELGSLEVFLRIIESYDAQTLFADRQVERLHEGLEALGLGGDTLWIVTADHGEGLASHGVAGHGMHVYQEQLRVPLVLHASDGSLAPRVVTELVGHVDLLPTVAEALGLRVSAHERLYDGRSLWPLARGEQGHEDERALFAQRRPVGESELADQAAVYALQRAGRKLVRRDPGGEEYFDLARDPLELTDLGAAHPGAAELRAELEQRLRAYSGLRGADVAEEVPEEWMEELRALGYVR